MPGYLEEFKQLIKENPVQTSDTKLSNPSKPVVKKLRQHQKRMNETEIDELVAAYAAGATINELAEKFECNRGTVSAHLKRRGVSNET